MRLIVFKDVKKNYGFKNVLDDFNLEINEGEKVSIVGVNGMW